MKTTTFGTAHYFISVYYTDKNNKMNCYTEVWWNKKNAFNMFNLYKKYEGKEYKRATFEGVISNVFVFMAKQCRFE